MTTPPSSNDEWAAWAEEAQAEIDRLLAENEELRAKVAEQAETIRRLES